MSEPMKNVQNTQNTLMQAITQASQNAEQAKFGQVASAVISLMNGVSQIEPFRDVVVAAGAVNELSQTAVQRQRGLILSKDDLKSILRYVDMAKALPLTEKDAEIYLGYQKDNSFFKEEKHKFLLPQNQVKFDRPIVEHADQWAALVVQIQRLGKYLRDYAASFLKESDDVIKVLKDLSDYLTVRGGVIDDKSTIIVVYGTDVLRAWKKNTRFYRDKVEVIYRNLTTFRNRLNETISKSIVDRSSAIASLNLSAEQIELQNQIKALEDEKEGLEKEYSQAVGLAFTGMAGLLFSGPLGIISWSITGGIYGDKAEKIRKEKDTKGEKIAELQNELTACSAIEGNISKLKTSMTDMSHALFAADIGFQHLLTAWDSMEQDLDNAIEHLNRMDDPEYASFVGTLRSEVKEARTSWADCDKVADDLMQCFNDAYTEYMAERK